MAFSLFFVANHAAAFEIDLALGQMKKLDGQVIVDDLAVGDQGMVESRAFCFKGKNLFLSPQGEVIDRSRTPYDIVVSISAEKTASVTIQDARRLDGGIDREVLISALTSIARRFSCDLWDNDVNEGRFISVTEINGKRRLSELTQ